MASSTRQRPGLDVVSVMTLYLVLLFAIPATAIVAPLGTLGSPATIFSLVALAWYLFYQFHRTYRLPGGNSPLRNAMLGFILGMLLVYGHSMTTFIPPSERTNADSSMIRIIGTAGMVLALTDGVADRERLRTMGRRLTIAAGLMALLGIAQFATGQAFIDRLTIPGLTPADLGDNAVAARGGFFRPSGSATNPIEFGAVIAMVFPVSVVLAQTARRRKVLAWLPPALIGLTTLFSISRTTIICLAVAVALLFPGWRRPVQIRMAVFGVIGLLGAGVAVPGLLGTLRGMFTGAGGDSSVLSRTQSYGVAWSYIERQPWLGRGYNTFLPSYWILDNAYLQFLIGCGVVGLVALLALVASAVRSAAAAMRGFVAEDDRLLARALMAGTAAGAVSLFFFDALNFPQSAGCLTMMMGLCGAALRISRTDPGPVVPLTSSAEAHPPLG